MRAVIRADAGHAIGLGHLIRCTTLGRALCDAGWQVQYVARDTEPFRRVLGCYPDLALAGEASFDRLPASEAQQLAAFAARADWVIIDHYGVDRDWLQELKRLAPNPQILLFDDHQQRAGADLRLAPLQSAAPNSLTGLEYMILRSSFWRSDLASGRSRRGWVIAIGGTDPDRQAEQCVRALRAIDHTTTPLTVLSSDRSIDPLLASWRATAHRLDWVGERELAELFLLSEAALISTSGLAFEALAMGCPIVGLRWAENQRLHAATLAGAGLPIADTAPRAAMLLASNRAAHRFLTDGRGAVRVIEALQRKESTCPAT
jgi:spore coat polysaccharide biosynthesis predicted glycosyltransferase SpsG